MEKEEQRHTVPVMKTITESKDSEFSRQDWTLNTLERHLSAKISLIERYFIDLGNQREDEIKKRFEGVRLAVEDALAATEKAMNLSAEAQQRAIDKAEQASIQRYIVLKESLIEQNISISNTIKAVAERIDAQCAERFLNADNQIQATKDFFIAQLIALEEKREIQSTEKMANMTAQMTASKESLAAALITLKEQSAAALTATKEQIIAAALASEKAITKAEIAQEKRNEGMNEFRQAMVDQQANFAPRTETDFRIQALDKQINLINDQVIASRGRSQGMTSAGAIIIASITGVGGIVAIIATIIAMNITTGL